jgi:hypothetical protein
MRPSWLMTAAITLCCTAPVAEAQQLDPALRGVWSLDVAKSDFGGEAAPKMGQVNWTEHGWVFVLLSADNHLYADGAVTDHGCTLIGVSSDFSCEVKVVSPRHVRLRLLQGPAVRRIGDIELVDSNTTRTTHHVTPAEGAPYVETTLWRRDASY